MKNLSTSVILKMLFPFLLFQILSPEVRAASEVVEIPPEELARESVLPVFDHMVTVKNRKLDQEGRFEAGLSYGWAMSEPIFNVNKISLTGYYHWTDDHAFGLIYSKNSAGTTNYAKQLYDEYRLDFSRAPYPEYSILGDYNFNAYYGKLSLTKKGILNTMTFLSGALGMVKYVHKSYPLLGLGFGQKFFLTSNLSLRFDMRFYINQGPIPFLKDSMDVTKTPPSYSQFDDRLNYTTNLDLGLNYLF